MPPSAETSWRWRSPTGITLLVFLGIAAFFLVTEHTAHLIPALPWLLLLSCPFMHVFMHREHSGHSGHGSHNSSEGGPRK